MENGNHRAGNGADGAVQDVNGTLADVDGSAENRFWAALAARVLHPVQIEIVEAMLWIDQPLTAVDLLRVFEAKRSGLRIERHLRRLVKLGAARPTANGEVHAPIGQRPYRLVKA